MLIDLSIHNVALAEDLNIEFRPGLNVLTGETGAGKSIIVGAISALMGARIGAGLVREGEDRAAISASFDVNEGSAIAARLLNDDLWEDGPVIFSREILKGRSRCRLNGRLVNLSQLGAFGDELIDIHGQHDHESLMKTAKHVDLLDAVGGDDIRRLRREVARLYDERTTVVRDIDRLMESERDRERREDLLKYQIEEIAAAGLNPDEEEALDIEGNRLANAERLSEAVQAAYAGLYDGDGIGVAATHAIGEAVQSLVGLVSADPELAPIIENLQSALYTLEEAARDLRVYGESVTFDPQRLEQVNERRQLIAGLKRKYGGTVAEVVAFLSRCEEELASLSDSEQTLHALNKRLDELTKQWVEQATKLSAARKRVAGPLSSGVTEKLRDLNMDAARFNVDFDVRPDEEGVSVPGVATHITRRGIDHVQFLFSANRGEKPKPLSEIASGGEMSRVMLAIKSTMAEADRDRTLIFDEVDAGLGGHTAEKVADALSELALTHQVIVVTHLAQIAVRADHHMMVEKVQKRGRTTIDVRTISGDDRVREIGRMLDGLSTSKSIDHAKALLQRVSRDRI